MQNETTGILDFITEQFGPINNTISEIVPGSRVAIDIQVILPSQEHDFITLVTTGMSDCAMDDSEECKGSKYAELVLKLPANWPLSRNEMTNQEYYWPLKWLRMVAHIPHQYDGWLEEGVMLPNGEPPTPFASNTALSCILISTSKEMRSFIDSKNRVINFYLLIPIYTEERMLALQYGHEYIIERFEESGITDVLDIQRERIKKKGKFKDIGKFKEISFRGRVAYGISCFENAIIALNYDLNSWKIVVNYLWEFTNSNNLDDCNSATAELIPESLLESKEYDEDDFERLTENEFYYLYNLYQKIDESINTLLSDIHELGQSHAYSSISGYGEDSLNSLEILIYTMIKNNYPLPDIKLFEKSSIRENKGWGNKFDGTKLSKIL
ncbi:suppressor of fused domain protein [Lysinibacillus xylanilyticus]|uniref:suppressor of fused domain protein n=1 Tax=Lysinibacillus xylanilyticus TaxID=582475 RepID=UPI003820CFA8